MSRVLSAVAAGAMLDVDQLFWQPGAKTYAFAPVLPGRLVTRAYLDECPRLVDILGRSEEIVTLSGLAYAQLRSSLSSMFLGDHRLLAPSSGDVHAVRSRLYPHASRAEEERAFERVFVSDLAGIPERVLEIRGQWNQPMTFPVLSNYARDRVQVQFSVSGPRG